jgi:hypothetical protein
MPQKQVKDARIDELNIGDAAAGSTLDGNIQILSSTPYPIIAFRNGTTDFTKIVVDTTNALTFIDVTQALIFRRNTDLSTLFYVDYAGIINVNNTVDVPASPVADSARIWIQSGEAKIMDESGNITTFSPHNIQGIDVDPNDPFPVTIHHKNSYLGTEEWIYMSKLARLVEQLTGETLIYSQDIPQRTWAADETEAEQRRAAAITAYDATLAKIEELPPDEQVKRLELLGERPQPYTVRTEPDWITQRKNRTR